MSTQFNIKFVLVRSTIDHEQSTLNNTTIKRPSCFSFFNRFLSFGVTIFPVSTPLFILFAATVLFDVGPIFRLDAALHFSMRLLFSPVACILQLIAAYFLRHGIFLGHPLVAVDNHNNLPYTTKQSNGRYISLTF